MGLPLLYKSNIVHWTRTSNIEHRTLNIEHRTRTSYFGRRQSADITSNIGHRTSNSNSVQRTNGSQPTSNRTSFRTSNIEHWTRTLNLNIELEHWTWTLKTDIVHRTSAVGWHHIEHRTSNSNNVQRTKGSQPTSNRTSFRTLNTNIYNVQRTKDSQLTSNRTLDIEHLQRTVD